MITQKLFLLTAVFLGQVVTALPQAPGPNIYHEADMALRQNLVNAEFASNPANAAVIAQIKRLAGKGDLKARLALLRIGDPDTLAFCIDRLRARHWFDSQQAADLLGMSGRLELIGMLRSDLDVDEPATPEVMQAGEEHFKIPRVSVLAAEVIQSLIRKNDAFPSATRRWADQLDSLSHSDLDRKRESIRAWCKQNEGSLRTNQYNRVQPSTL